jgi:hypothetical protein
MKPKNTPAAPSQPPSWRTPATVLLILHLFALSIAVATNAAGSRSLLSGSFSRIPLVKRYLGLLTMDVAYDFELSGIEPEQGTYELRLIERTRSSSAAEENTATTLAALPNPDFSPAIRRHRYRQLAYYVAFFDRAFQGNDDLRTQLPVAIAERWLADLGKPPGAYVLECRSTPAKRLPKAIENAPVPPKEGTVKSAAEAGPPPPIVVELLWDPDEERYLGTRPAPPAEQAPLLPAPSGSTETSAEPEGGSQDSVSPETDGQPVPPSEDAGRP